MRIRSRSRPRAFPASVVDDDRVVAGGRVRRCRPDRQDRVRGFAGRGGRRGRSSVPDGRRTLLHDRRRRHGGRQRSRVGIRRWSSNQVFASRFDRRRGDLVELATPSGRLRVRIAGIHLELTPGDLGTIRLDRALYRGGGATRRRACIEVSLPSGGDRQRVIDTIRAAVGRAAPPRGAHDRRTAARVSRHAGAADDARVSAARLRDPQRAGRCRERARRVDDGAWACEWGAACRRRDSESARALSGSRPRSSRAWPRRWRPIVGSVLGWMQVEILLRGMLGMSIIYSYPRAVALLGGMGVVMLTSAAGWVLGRRAGAWRSARHCVGNDAASRRTRDGMMERPT